MKQKVLIISPFAFFPCDAGHRRRTLQSLDFFSECEVTFLLYAFEGDWIFRHQSEDVEQMRPKVHEFLTFRGRNDIGAPPASGHLHNLDEWYDDAFDSYLRNLISNRAFDCVVVHNVWMSKYLDIFPQSTVKIIETHDLFSARASIFKSSRIAPEFFMLSEDDEVFGLERADIAIAIQDKERDWIRSRAEVDVITVPYFSPDQQEEPTDVQLAPGYKSASAVRFGFLASSHAFNISGIRDLIKDVDSKVRDTFAPIEIVVAGSVCDSLSDMPMGSVRLIGRVDTEQQLYDEVDFVVAPVMTGTGFKVKVADSIAQYKPILATLHAAEGVDLDPMSVVETIEDMAERMVDIAFNRPALADFAVASHKADKLLKSRMRMAKHQLQRRIRGRQLLTVFDLRSVSSDLVLVYLAGLTMAMRLASDVSKVVVQTNSRDVMVALGRYDRNIAVLFGDAVPDLKGYPVVLIDASGVSVGGKKVDIIDPEAKPDVRLLMDRETVSNAGLSAVPLFGDNRYWDPLFSTIIKMLKKGRAPNFTGVVALGEGGAEGAPVSQLLKPDGGLHFCANDDLPGLSGLVSALLNEKVSGLLDVAETETVERVLMHRVATVAGASVLSVHPRDFPALQDKGIRNFWTSLFAGFRLRYGRRSEGVLNIYADSQLTLAAIAKSCRGVYGLETDDTGSRMLWTSGLDELQLRINWPSNKGAVKLKIFGQAHEGVVGEVITVEFEGDQVKEEPITTSNYGGMEFYFTGAADQALSSDIVIKFPKGFEPEADGEGADDRRYSYLLYGVELDAIRSIN